LKRASWGAIFGGTFTALAIMTVLGTFGIAIGLATVDPASGDTPSAQTFSITGGIWWLVSGIVALFSGAWVTGRLAGLRRQQEGALHGIVTWGLATVVTMALMTSAIGGLVSGGMRIMGTGLTVASDYQNLQPIAGSTVEQKIDQMIDTVQQSEQNAQIRADARRVAEATASALSQAAFWVFFYLLATAIASGVGGYLGAPRSDAPLPPPLC
jgi:hypothetical protein